MANDRMALSYVAERPWAITEQGLQLITAIASRDEFFADIRDAALKEALAAKGSELLNGASNAHVRDGVAIMFVKGPLFRYAETFTRISAATSYGELRKDLARVIDDPSVDAIMWNVDSPGGEVNGCQELADAIYAARGKKPMAAYVGGMGASAAYWLAAAVGDISIADTAEVGSIGVKTMLIDDSGEQKEEGRRRVEIVSDQSPAKASDPSDDDYRARLKAQCTDLASVFIQRVASFRGVSPQIVQSKYGRGAVLVGARAVDAGLADRISDFETSFAALRARARAAKYSASSTPTPSGEEMEATKIATLLGLSATAGELDIERRAHALGQLERSVLTATRSTDHDAAIGKIGAAMEAVAERDEAKAALKAAEQEGTREEFRHALKSAIKDSRLTLGQLPSVAKLCLSEESAAAAIAAMAACDAQEKKPLLRALCSVDIKPKALDRLKSYLAMATPQLPAAKREPPADEKNRKVVTASYTEEALATAADAAGISIERARELADVRSVSDLPAPKNGAALTTKGA